MLKLITGQFNLKNAQGLSAVETLSKEGAESRVLLVLDITGPSAKDSLKKIKKIFEDDFFQEETEVLMRFEDCMKKVNEALVSSDDEITGIIAAQERTELHVSQTGEGEAYLIRRGKLSVIVENVDIEKNENETFTSIASGELMVDDRLVFSSLRVLRYATVSQVVAVLSEGISEGLEAIKELVEIEAGKGALMCAHARGESVFAHAEKTTLKVPRNLRASFFSNLANKFDAFVYSLADKLQKPHDAVRNGVFVSGILAASLVLVLSIQAVSVDNTTQEKRDAFKIQLLKAEKELKKAETRALMSDLDSANAILDQVEKNINVMLKEGFFRKEGLVIQERIQNQRDKANRVTRIKNMDERLLASVKDLMKEGETLRGFSVLNDEVYAYSQKSLYKTVLDHIDESIEIVSGESEIIRASAMDDRNIIVFTLSSGEIIEYSAETGVSSAQTSDESGFKLASAVDAYGRYLYFLTPEENQVWKYERRRDSFSGASAWVQEEMDLSEAIDLAIDGSVYLLLKEGGVKLLHKGKEIPLSIQGGSSDLLKGASKLYTDLDLNNVYFLNLERNSVIKMEKVNRGLQYVQEYVFATEINDFYVNLDEQRLIVSDGGQLYEISL